MIHPTTRISAETYYQLPEYKDHELIQLINGEVVIDMPPIPLHQAIVVELIFLFMTIAKQRGGRVFTAPTEVYLDEHSIFEPDVLYLKADSQCRIEDKRLVGAPDLVVEVLSPSTAKYDRQEKYQAYQQHGVGEYWIVDPLHQVIEVWTREAEQFSRQGAYGLKDSFTSLTLGEAIHVETLLASNA